MIFPLYFPAPHLKVLILILMSESQHRGQGDHYAKDWQLDTNILVCMLLLSLIKLYEAK